jgi:subtilisin family serine protease
MDKSRFPQVIESGKVVLTLTPDKAYVEFRKDLPTSDIEAFLKDYEFQLVKEEPDLLPQARSFNEVFTDRLWLRLPGEASIEEFLEKLLQDDRVRLASPVYHRADLLPKQTGLTFSDFLLVKFKSEVSDTEIASLIKELEVEDLSRDSNLLGENMRRVSILDPKRRHALEVAELFAQSPLVEQVGPDWSQLHSAISAIPNDSYWQSQWNLQRINARAGWNISTGSSRIVIAILDTGCDLNHIDLRDKYVPAYNQYDALADTNIPEDDHGHGTCCAGIAAASSNNSEGVAGVAWGCSIMPVRMMQNNILDHESWIVYAIGWARTHGARVISMSWHWDGPHIWAENAIMAAYRDGIVMIAASGNDEPTLPPNTVNFPASHPAVMAVGAFDQELQRCVWEPGRKASQFGPALSVMAPGVTIWSTDRSGLSAGFNTTGTDGDAAGNYYNNFDGTSAAAPHVAGLAGLLLSVDPSLTNDEVFSIIQKTAEKVGEYTYIEDGMHPAGAWNNEMGYGRINVFRSLSLAMELARG